MPLQMPYTDRSGNDYTASYWKISDFAFNLDAGTIRVAFKGYASQAKSNMQPIDAPKQYLFTKAESTAILGTVKNKAIGLGVRDVIEAAAKAKLEGNPPAQGQPDTRKSFFDLATII